MHPATTATGRPLPPPGKTPPKNCPVPLTSRAPRHPAAANPHVTSELQRYIPALIDNHRRSPRKFNRQPRRLESAISLTKQTSAPQINRQQIATFKITHPSISNRHNQHVAMRITDHAPRLTNHSFTLSALCEGPITTRSRSNRHTPRLENAISRRKQTLGTRSNRHFLQVCGSDQRRIAAAAIPPQLASNIVSNRQSQILEITVNLSKQTIAPRSNRHKNALLASRLPRGSRRGPKGMGSRDALLPYGQGLATRVRGSRNTDHGSRIAVRSSPLTNHASPLLVIYSSHTPNPRSSNK